MSINIQENGVDLSTNEGIIRFHDDLKAIFLNSQSENAPPRQKDCVDLDQENNEFLEQFFLIRPSISENISELVKKLANSPAAE